ncbi:MULTISPECIES: GntR family transcriptional regulator [unclassified Methylibium]|uniref:GntR family transcriptional regulator n=1 Tax=unclassified Methylibium TaxID=2633235 RepID=UPI0006F53977|nr:GntR family transcriptional regulator [Methylibium sp. Root1272]KQW65381.1 GntR family transcriptional regulator [Methylibium sp. Root1272]
MSTRPARRPATAASRARATAAVAPATTLPATAVRSNLAEQAYARLKAEIHDFLLVPGDRFSEAEIGTRLGVSRTPVREALFRLRNEGFLEVESKSGWYVRPIDFDKLEQLYDLRVLLELASVAKLCTRADDAPELDALKKTWLLPVAERLSDGREVGALDEQFHATLVRAAGNAEIARVHWDVTERIRIIRRLDFTRGDRIDATYTEHAKILRAVMQRKLDQAQLLLRSHVEQSKSEVRKITLAMLQQARTQLAR